MPQSRKISRVSIFLSLRTLSVLVVLFLQPFLFSQVSYNHPEIEWQSFETDPFVTWQQPHLDENLESVANPNHRLSILYELTHLLSDSEA